MAMEMVSNPNIKDLQPPKRWKQGALKEDEAAL